MSTPFILEVAGSALPFVSTLFVGMAAWVGVGINSRLEKIAHTLHTLEVSWTNKLAYLDGRLTQLETVVHLYHPEAPGPKHAITRALEEIPPQHYHQP
jgi:hypothetical protein